MTNNIIRGPRPRPKVWVPHKVKKDLSMAKRFGSLRFLSESKGIFPDSTPQEILEITKEMVDNFSQVKTGDYLVLVGDPILIYICGMCSVRAMNSGVFVKLLKYDRQDEGYYTTMLGNL